MESQNQVTYIEYQISGIRYPVSDIEYQVMSIIYRVSDIEYQISSIASIRYQISGPKYILVSDIKNKTSKISSIRCISYKVMDIK